MPAYVWHPLFHTEMHTVQTTLIAKGEGDALAPWAVCHVHASDTDSNENRALKQCLALEAALIAANEIPERTYA